MTAKRKPRTIRITISLFLLAVVVVALSTYTPNLSETTWILQSINGETPYEFHQDITLSFASRSQHYGISGHNGYYGTYTIRGRSFTFEQISMAYLVCSEADPRVDYNTVVRQEYRYIDTLDSTMSFTLTSGTLTLTGVDGTLVYALADEYVPIYELQP